MDLRALLRWYELLSLSIDGHSIIAISGDSQ
jgi:hypothetical protein